MKNHIAEIRKAGTLEKKMYKPIASLLTAISTKMYAGVSTELLDLQKQKAHRDRYHLDDIEECHLKFIDHHSSAPTCFPNDALSDVKDAPDLLGVYDIKFFEDNKGTGGVYKGVPHHRVEAIVEAKSEKNGGGRRQAATYAYRHHQARPDRPGFYVLVIKTKWYQVLYSDPTGVFASPQTHWPETDLLAAYLYSHYHPPDRHFLWDDTIRWIEPLGPCSQPSWEITCDGKVYKNGQFIFIGEPWSRLTTAFNIEDPSGKRVIIKDSYRGTGRRFKEEDVLDHIHAEGDFLGVVRLKLHESVMDGKDYLAFDLKGEEEKRTRERWVLLDTGLRFLKARTVQDLLMAVYDTLEVHRSQLHLRNVLHRDMSSYNILMYPIWGDVEGREINQHLSPMIQDVLAGSTRPVEKRFPSCLSIDYDNAALLDSEDVSPDDLKHRTGTPMYIARSVCLGEVFTQLTFRVGPPMPGLSDEARALYVGVHGEQRYERYKDIGGTLHGALPPDLRQQFKPRPVFRHRPEHDVESVYWSMVSALLRVHPKNVDREAQADEEMVEIWEVLLSHKIPRQRSRTQDKRQSIIGQSDDAWEALLLGDMKDIGALLFNISEHVNPEYALWGDGLQPDHLHEAVQRLILQYLVDHKEPIELDPEYTRPITASIKSAAPTKQVSTLGTTTGAVSPEKRLTRASARSSQTRVDAESATGDAGKGKSVDVDIIAQSGSSSGTRVSDASRPVVIEPKRKSLGHAGRGSKRLRDNAGLPQSIEEHSEDDA
ncbi:hypothetical protein GSI_09051 [Ganoderma sinense ZZ0214-1]|uniref:Fungal-type protein kinase domain-containing protein n=1 Tax=Ganoderma sinense ZZ0214-1 TaxID=1077348 RepID=A0A2G8S5I6_9APHY|nr:hypothetical protein GSI_09051 [Ganoderma sinense ZZ0214-1]